MISGMTGGEGAYMRTEGGCGEARRGVHHCVGRRCASRFEREGEWGRDGLGSVDFGG